MVRSLQINHEQENKNIIKVYGGSDNTSITFPCEGYVDEKTGQLKPYTIVVKVDGQTNNASFSVDTIGNWFKYKIERSEYNGGYVKILLFVGKNLDTAMRFGTMTIQHNASPLSLTVNIYQEPTIYSIETDTQKIEDLNGIGLDERTIKVIAKGGSELWKVKKIEQYRIYQDKESSVAFDGSIQCYKKNKCVNEECKDKVSFDGNICPYCNKSDFVQVDNNHLYLRSYGNINVDNSTIYKIHICHSDINNLNKTDNTGVYEVEITCKFKTNTGESY